MTWRVICQASRDAYRGHLWRRVLLAALVWFAFAIPSDWTQDVPARYGARHPGLHHSILYPPLNPGPSPITGSVESFSQANESAVRGYPVGGYPGFQYAVLP